MTTIERITPAHIEGIHHALDVVARERKYPAFLEAPPEFRGQGIGTRLIAVTLAEASRAGITRVELTVYMHNETAKKLYEKMGFQVEGLQKNSVIIDGVYIDSFMMAAHLPDTGLSGRTGEQGN